MTAGPRPGVDLLRDALARARRVRFRARGASMRPALRDGDLVSVVSARAEQLRIGDVVCYEPGPGRLVLHRLVRRRGGMLVVKGDALPWVEEIPGARVLGRVAGFERPRGAWRLARGLARLARRGGERWSMLLWHA